MLYKLTNSYVEHYSALNVFKYITFRTLLAFLTSLIISLAFGERFITFIKKIYQNGQPIRLDGPASHFAKKGVPTMGGLLIVISVLVSCLLWADFNNLYVLVVLMVFTGYAAIGFTDDYLKVSQNNHRGLRGHHKLLWQTAVAAVACIIIVNANPNDNASVLSFPYLKNFVIELGLFYLIFGVLVVVGSSNAVNLTDGLDGLAIGPVMISCLVFGLIAYLVGHSELADYLKLIKVSGTSEIAVIMGAIIGAGLGFLWFNCPPAQIIMGDIGSLSLGGAIGITAVATKHEIILAIVGGLFVIEALSVMIQVASFKLTGKRVFKMAPIHHHFEKKGWAETKVVFRFWIIAIVFAVIGAASLKLR